MSGDNESRDLAGEVASLRASVEAHLRMQAGREAFDLLERLDAVERRARAGESRSWVERHGPHLEAFARITGGLMPLVLLLIGYWLNDTVSHALRAREVAVQEGHLDLEATQTLEHLLQSLRVENVAAGTAEASALLIAGYGRHGLRPLVLELGLGAAKYTRIEAAEQALASYALSDERGEACRVLARAASPPMFDDEGTTRVVRLLGRLDCREARSTLAALAQTRGIDPQAAGDDGLAGALREALAALGSGS